MTLRTMTGVLQVRVNPSAGSITINYDPARLTQSDLLAALEQVGCLGAARRSDEGVRQLGELFGKALVGAVVQRAMEQTARTLVGALV